MNSARLHPTEAPFRSPLPIVAAAGFTALLLGVLIARSPELGISGLFAVAFLPLVLLNLPAAVALWVPLVFVAQLTPAPTLVALLIALAWLAALPVRRQFVAEVLDRHRVLFGLVAALVVWVLISVSWASDLSLATEDLWMWVVVGAIMVVLPTAISTREQAVVVCGAFVFGAVVSVVGGLLLPGAGVESGGDARFGGTLGDANYLAAGLAPAIAIAIGLAAAIRSKATRLLLAAAILILAAALAATGSRGGLISVLVAIPASLLLARGRRLRVGALIALVIATAGIWLATTSPATYDRVRSFDDGGTGRVDLWTVATRMAQDHPLVGVGVNNFRAEAPRYVLRPGALSDSGVVVETPRVVHNVYLQAWAETGIVGVALLIGVIVGSLAATWRALRGFDSVSDRGMAVLTRAVLIGEAAVVTSSIFISNSTDQRTWIVLALGPMLVSVFEHTRYQRRAS